MTIEYPIRVQIVDAGGVELLPGINAKTPEKSRPHIGKQGWAYEDNTHSLPTVRIELDEGTILYGFECWWRPIRGGDDGPD